ncbi:MAG: hypothetical protein KGI11_09130 [Thaumarchaeota archaeon]|nr:hypothetical protein [Nitrososphaerota archaeon]
MPKLDILQRQLDSIKTEIKALSGFRDIPSVRKLRRQLEGESSVVKAKIAKITEPSEKKEMLQSEAEKLANKNCSEKMKRTWRHLKAIKENYPIKMSTKELRTALKKHRQGLETDIPDVAWRNPSP